MRFIVIGEGFAPAKLIETLMADARATVAGIFTETKNSRRLEAVAAKAGLELSDARDLNTKSGPDRLRSVSADWLLNANSTLLLSSDVLRAARRGALNLHPGLLPEYAGLHVHQWAIRNGETEFGATIHHMSPALDTGDVAAVTRFPLDSSETGLSLFQRCMDAGIRLLGQVVAEILNGSEPQRIPQDLGRRHVYRHRDALDDRIDWTWSAREIVDFIRAGNYEPFRSPTYTARLDLPEPGAQSPTILGASVVEAEPCSAGSFAGWMQDCPVIGAGDRQGVRLGKAKLGGSAMGRTDWEAYFENLGRDRLIGRQGDM